MMVTSSFRTLSSYICMVLKFSVLKGIEFSVNSMFSMEKYNIINPRPRKIFLLICRKFVQA